MLAEVKPVGPMFGRHFVDPAHSRRPRARPDVGPFHPTFDVPSPSNNKIFLSNAG